MKTCQVSSLLRLLGGPLTAASWARPPAVCEGFVAAISPL
jgi:hypothetical protein